MKELGFSSIVGENYFPNWQKISLQLTKKIGISNHLTNSEEGMFVAWLGKESDEKNSLKSLAE